MRTKKINETISGKIRNQEFIDATYENLVIRDAIFENTTFNNVHFNNCYLGFNSSFIKSKFIKCKFYGKYSSLGNPGGILAAYNSCEFVDSEFTGQEILGGTNFIDSSFSGLFKNIVLRDSTGDLKNHGTNFLNCNLENLIFKDIHIYGKEVFKNTILPKKELLLLDNKDDKLIKRTIEICSNVSSDIKIESEIIFKPSLRSGQEIIILDKSFINTFFKSDNSRKLFDEIINGFEL